MNKHKILYFDIETVTGYSDFATLEKENPRKAKNFKSRYERRRNTSMKYSTVEDAYEKSGMFFPEYGKIIVLSYGFIPPNSDDVKIESLSIDDPESEKELIYKIYALMKKISSLGFMLAGQNIKGFDVPFIIKKFLEYGFQIPSSLKTLNKKPWEVNFIDTMDLWKGIGWDQSSLDEICEVLNLPSPKADISGSDVGPLFWGDRDIARIAKYCENDVRYLPAIVEKIFSANKS